MTCMGRLGRMMMKTCVTIQKLKKYDFNWQSGYEVFVPTKDCRKEVESTENNFGFPKKIPVFSG